MKSQQEIDQEALDIAFGTLHRTASSLPMSTTFSIIANRKLQEQILHPRTMKAQTTGGRRPPLQA